MQNLLPGHWRYFGTGKRQHRDGPAFGGHELDLDGLPTAVAVYDGPQITFLEAVLLDVAGENYRRPGRSQLRPWGNVIGIFDRDWSSHASGKQRRLAKRRAYPSPA